MNNWGTFKKLYNVGIKDTADNFDYHFKEQFADVDFTGKSVLEVGCGKGFVSLYIAMFTGAYHVTALDEAVGHGSEVGIMDALKENIARIGLESRLEAIEADALTYHSESFDIIIANNCLHHFVDNGKQYWEDPIVADGYQNMFRHFAELLKSDGRLIIREMDPFNVWRYVLPKLVFPTIDWSIHPPLSGWLDAIRKATFDIVYIKTVVPYKLRSVQKIFANGMFRHLLRGGFLIYSRKAV
ncbi:MAG: class I SAM-dependent methyltransferase [Thermodesulfovibrionia bacterium]|nr:class I SAM-dependent methyltransferase [Thermodesulfovibrionia bacterium]